MSDSDGWNIVLLAIVVLFIVGVIAVIAMIPRIPWQFWLLIFGGLGIVGIYLLWKFGQ